MRMRKRRIFKQEIRMAQKRKHEGIGSERVITNKSSTTDRSYGAQVQARTRGQQGEYCCMNYVTRVLHLLCTIGKKEGISTGIAW
jgi:hypothetical protein